MTLHDPQSVQNARKARKAPKGQKAPEKTDAPHTADGVYFGLMSGTSMDGVDGVAVRFAHGHAPEVLAEAFVHFAPNLRAALFALQQPGENEIERAALAANALVTRYAVCCHELLRAGKLLAEDVRAIGVHGQTIRHRPEKGYTWQINNPALLAEMTHIDVIADFRSRDIAAGGQGAPLVPAFHATLFGTDDATRVVCNLGGISNITILPAVSSVASSESVASVASAAFASPTTATATHGVRGFDCGPANALLDLWAARHLGKPYDEGGQFAASGQPHQALLDVLLDEPFFAQPPPKSTGRDLFNEHWLDNRLKQFEAQSRATLETTSAAMPGATGATSLGATSKVTSAATSGIISGITSGTPSEAAFRMPTPADVQATLVELTAVTLAREIARHAGDARAVYVCGGGARNPTLMAALKTALRTALQTARQPTLAHAPSNDAPDGVLLTTTDALGVPPHQVEALAFAWLAMRCLAREPGNLPAVTGAAGDRVLGAIYPR